MTSMITDQDVERAAEIVLHFARMTVQGERRAYPLPLYEAMMYATVQSVVEGVIIDGARYALGRRPAGEKVFGENRLHIIGGCVKPQTKGISMLGEMAWMARNEYGFGDISHVAGPIATYTWQHGEHPIGWPRVELHVFRAIGSIPERPDLVWYPYGQYPAEDEILAGRAGEIHLDFLREFHTWLENPQRPCTDLNQR
jgi:hypothetical protein